MRKIDENHHRELADVQSEWVCNRLKQLRYLAGLSLAEAGELLQCDPKSIAAVERGRYASPFSTIAAYVSAYGVSLPDFFALCPSKLPKERPEPRPDEMPHKLTATIGDEGDKQNKRFKKYMCEKYPHLSTAKMEAHAIQVLKNLKAEKAKQAKKKS